MDVRSALKLGLAQLREASVPSFTLAAELLLLHVLGRNRTWMYAHPEEFLTQQQTDEFAILLARRASGVPTQHLTGKQEFWSLEFEVTPDVLIPRPETEHLLEVALDRLALREIRAGRKQTLTGEGLYIADIGTGSGCIAVALANELPGARVTATDLSPAALSVARRNAALHNVSDRIHFVEANLLGDSAGPFDAILSNPPYVGRRERDALMREVREHEPELALYGGEEGYEFYADLISEGSRALKRGGLLVLELGHNSLPAVRPLLDPPDWIHVSVTNDLAGIPRVIAAEKT